ncbi:uncharacterized protein LOC105211182 [Zeugodacus cucurbitae]|uniref:uncharacterized protein LOC105211182 n=1 Tax=Zeugodacus cucurbitae TaxID=28588 RepID=UPI0023D939C8|nr:uncharacterized protein LOC105211182 [Zeugodacus cucurbitae]
MGLHSVYHYDGDCGVAQFFMRLSGWTLKEFALQKLPNGYAEHCDFGPRVAKYDWFELLAKYPVLIALLVIAGITILFWLFWLCCKVRGLQKSKKKRHRCCLCFTTFLLLLLLLPLGIGLYLTFRTNYLLRRTKDDSKQFKDTGRSALDNEHAQTLPQTEYEASPTQVTEELNEAISNEYADWQQIIAENEEKNLEQLNYLYTNREFYRTALQSLKDYAYELVILGLEMDDLLRTLSREAIIFLQANVKNASSIDAKMLQNGHINMWHLNAVYQQYTFSLEYLEYLLKAYENITVLANSIAEHTPEANENFAPALRGFPKLDELGYDPTQEEPKCTKDPKLPSAILYLAMIMFFVTVALVYILLMALAFGICRYYARANCMFKIFFFLNILTIPVLAILTVLHFLPTMVLHKEICHEHDGYRAVPRENAESLERSPFNNNGPNEALRYENDELSPTDLTRDNILTKVERMLPKYNIYQKNYQNSEYAVEEFPQEKWYESDVQGLLTNEDIPKNESYVKQHTKANTTDANIFLCKLNTIPNAVKVDLYEKEFVPIATELHEVLIEFKNRAQTNDYDSFTKRLESAQSELFVFEKFYALSKDNFLSILSERLHKKLSKHSKALRHHLQPSAGQRSAMKHSSKCGCLEDLLMIYAIGSALLVFTLFLTMFLSLLLYKLYKRGPPICAGPQPPKTDGSSARAPVAASEPPCETNTTEASAQSKVDGKDCAVPTVANCCAAPTGTPLINTVNFIPPVMGAFGCQQNPPMMYPQNPPQMCAPSCHRNPPQMCPTPCPPQVCAPVCQPNPTQMCAPACQLNPTQMCGSNRNDGVILPLPCRSRTQMGCSGAEAQLVGGGTTNDKTVTVMVFQGPKDRQPLVTYPPPRKLEKK